MVFIVSQDNISIGNRSGSKISFEAEYVTELLEEGKGAAGNEAGEVL
jgi:hypothetical protein